jgi:hypothetical protein
VRPGGFQHVWSDPWSCCAWINDNSTIYGVTTSVIGRAASLVIVDVRFDSPPARSLPGFPAERVNVTITLSKEIAAVPPQDGRLWLHRYARLQFEIGVPLLSWAGGLCLWYPGDPPWLKWTWDDGLAEYLRIVQRHLWYEECWRRFGSWPAEDVPHGTPIDGRSFPILDQNLMRAN